MALELHIWGSAFGLPSIDPECLAALSYLGHAVPQEDWSLVASNDASVSPDHILPALHHEGTWTSGYTNIVSYLGQRNPVWSIDGTLSKTQQADTLAYSSYILSRGSALVAFSLYVSPSAWVDLTRPAYSSLLPFPLTWTVPLKIRSAAIAKTEHLGLNHLAADVDPEDGSSESNKTTAPITSTGFLRLPIKPTVSESMAPEQLAAIRLKSISEDFFSVLGEVRGGNRYFFRRDTPSSLDFLALGVLELLRVKTPHPFMKNCMERSQAGQLLEDFLHLMHTEPIIWEAGNPGQHLPWASPSPRGALGTLGQFTENVVQNVPGIGDIWRQWRGEGVKAEDLNRDPAHVLLAVGGTVTALVAVGGAMFFRSLPPFGEPTQYFEAPQNPKTGLDRFGEIGAMFNSLPDFEAKPRQPQNHNDTVYKSNGIEVAVDVEEEGSGLQPPRDGNSAEVGVDVKIGDNARRA
ncbi:outer mitochondrial membrane transport complex protein-domain-containing protein [Truncatella angustata]|uniref:Outer mitochondrial membrane transport complex protein-domain-containing protein n=1 Tax=Truncatella angustata TaxID=152316 RepID=A0A9P8USP1_9PEZI|nr:outer mitochondrial membrane transport complex protein-domain-containing protein [Truncatella angustata]KAH6657315.1 outer mitochondrial membrane transport complex protein-domain-containing protein [Truncatella angustata]